MAPKKAAKKETGNAAVKRPKAVVSQGKGFVSVMLKREGWDDYDDEHHSTFEVGEARVFETDPVFVRAGYGVTLKLPVAYEMARVDAGLVVPCYEAEREEQTLRITAICRAEVGIQALRIRGRLPEDPRAMKRKIYLETLAELGVKVAQGKKRAPKKATR